MVPRISVIVPTYNDGPSLLDCVRSIESQTLAADEILIVDDGSDDGESLRNIELAVSRAANIQIIRRTRGGAAAARNSGLNQSAGEYVQFVDADDRLHESCLERRYSKFVERPAITGSYSGYVAVTDSGDRVFSRFGLTTVSLADSGRIGRARGFPGGLPMFLLRADAVRKIGGLDESLRIMEDFDILLRMLRAGACFLGDDFPAYVRTIREHSLSRGSARSRWSGEMRFLRKAAAGGYFGWAELTRRYLVAQAKFLRSASFAVLSR